MIQINRGTKPNVLVENEEQWTNDYQRLLANDPEVSAATATRYRHPEVKQALVIASSGKCAYCESKMLHISFGDIDHILPKSHRSDLIVSWENLALVCTRCNHPKSSYYDPTLPLINPYLEDPREHIVFIGPLPLGESNRGTFTIAKLNLERNDLIERRSERIKSVKQLLKSWQAQIVGSPEREAVKRIIIDECSPDKEFSAAISDFLRLSTDWQIH